MYCDLKLKLFSFEIVIYVKYICLLEKQTLHFKRRTMKKIQQDLSLLPEMFKKVAFGIMVLSGLLVLLSILKVIAIDKEIIASIAQSVFLISLLMLVITRDKIEDELTMRIRLKAFAASFIYGVTIVIVEPLIHFLFGDSFLTGKGAIELLISMFLFYFIIKYIMKKSR